MIHRDHYGRKTSAPGFNGMRFEAPCTSCMYRGDCPEGIPVRSFMENWNHIELAGGGKVSDRPANHWGVSIGGPEKRMRCGKRVRARIRKLSIPGFFGDVKAAAAGGR